MWSNKPLDDCDCSNFQTIAMVDGCSHRQKFSGRNGRIAARLKNYEERPQQLAMADGGGGGD